MTITLDVSPELEGTLKEEAEASGVPLPDYLLRIVENRDKPRRKPTEDEVEQVLLKAGIIRASPPGEIPMDHTSGSAL